MNILILGGNGFIGRNLCNILAKDNHNVYAFDLEKQPYPIDNVQYIGGNFFNDNDIEMAVKNKDIVYHAISTINPSNSNKKYMQGYTYDFLQSVKLCEYSLKYGFRLIFLSSGGTVYGKQTVMPIKEETLAIPFNHYGNLKLCIENTIRTFNMQFGTDILIARIANPYGPGQDYSKGVGFIDAALKKALQDETIEIWGDGSVVRDYIYIDDACKMLAALMGYKGQTEVFNISSNSGTSQNEIIQILHKIFPDIKVEYLPARTVDVPQIILDNSRIMEIYTHNYLDIKSGILKYYQYLTTFQK